MMKDIYLKADVQIMEASLMKNERLSTYDLMHRASYGCYEKLQALKLIHRDSKVIICAGSGHNGGDALLLATHLYPYVKSLKVYVTRDKETHDTSYEKALDLITKDMINIQPLNQMTLDDFTQDLMTSDILIDGIYGTGFRHPLDAFLHAVIDLINQQTIPVVSLDIPSGLESDSGRSSQAIKATHTLSIGVYKPCHFLFDGLDYCGQLHLVNIGLIKPHLETQRSVIDISYFSKMTFKRRHNTHKYHYGNLLVVGGSIGLMGAPILSALAAYRSGCGLVSILYTEKTYPHRFHLIPEIMTHTLSEEKSFDEIIHKKTAVAFGMGLDHSLVYQHMLKDLLQKKIPLIIDAGGLFHLKALLKTLNHHPIVITPHAKELADLLSISTDQVLADPIKTIESFAKAHQLIVCLKGPTTLITDGMQTILCPFGHSGLAKAGSGDVLSGIIGALLAQGQSPKEACLLGVYILGESAHITSQTHGEVSMIATDVIDHIKDVFLKLNA